MEEFTYIITQDEINALPIGGFDGIIHIISNPAEAEKCAERLLKESILGFDTESRPAFQKGQNFPISLIQISTRDEAFLFMVKKTGIPRQLKELFANPLIIKVGVGMQHELSEMKGKKIECSRFADLERIAASHKFKQRGIRALAAFFLKIRISKSAQKSNWSRPDLTQAQIRYAATDAWVCLQIFLEMEKQGFITRDKISKEQPYPEKKIKS